MKEKNRETNTRPFFWSYFFTREIRFLVDVCVLCAAFVLAYLTRFEFRLSPKEIQALVVQLPLVVLIQFSLLFLCGAYSFFWRYFGLGEVRAFYKALGAASLFSLFFRLVLSDTYQPFRIPLSIIFIDLVLAFVGVIGVRILRRCLYERFEKKLDQDRLVGEKPRKVLLVGAGTAAALAINEIRKRRDLSLDIKGLLDDDPKKQGVKIQKVQVLGTTDQLPYLVGRLGVEEVIITINNAPRRDFQRILKICRQIPVKVQVIPSLHRLIQGEYKVSRIRDVEIEDLLGRETVRLDETSIGSFISGKRVLVTGAGGSIGSEMARQAARFHPSQLLLVERAEFALFEIDRELRGAFPSLPIFPLVGNISEKMRMETLFTQHRPQVIFHAAAHKHVPLMEHNPTEAIKNNTLATQLLAELAGEFGVESFVFISTDKAVNPTSVMGASKRLAELVIQHFNERYETRFLAVRFGNVLGSNGSVIPVFQDQILKGGPVTVTHPEMVRYFMTIPEAAQLVLQAGAMGRGGEIFLLDMGEPVKILDLAKEMITLCGLRPFENIDIVFTGVRPGEKLFEELSYNKEKMVQTDHPKIHICRIQPYPGKEIKEILKQLGYLSQNGHHLELRRYLMQILPEACLSLHDPGETQKETRNKAAA
ncbi:MAG: nucleoside-diphosphate sugar epimerase/dehydratase [Thermodesulfobacteriota bacterium]